MTMLFGLINSRQFLAFRSAKNDLQSQRGSLRLPLEKWKVEIPWFHDSNIPVHSLAIPFIHRLTSTSRPEKATKKAYLE
jgi:hypothetical protein